MSTIATVLMSFIVALAAAWGTFAFAFRTGGARGMRTLCAALWAAFGLGCIVALCIGWTAAAIAAYALAHGLLLVWWKHLHPSNDREWADDVSQAVGGNIEGNVVTLDKVRDFVWRTKTDYVQRCGAPQLRSRAARFARHDRVVLVAALHRAHADLVRLRLGSPRRFLGRDQTPEAPSFSEVGGYFKEFELVIIAAEERDIVRLRTNVRREQTYLFRLNFPPEVMRTLFLSYVTEANELKDTPRFYHTISSNCTTVLYAMLKRIVGRLPFSYRVLLSGYMPEYFYSIGRLDIRYPLAELRALGYISERGRMADQSPTFSADIRRGIPRL